VADRLGRERRGRITLERLDDRVSVRLDAPDCVLTCTALAVYVNGISAYQTA
jgi:hypothetical protein